MIQLKNFSVGFEGRPLLKDVSTDFRDGKLTSLIGENGAGKSTLLKSICGINADYSGEIIIDGRDIKKLTRKEIATVLSYVNTQRPRMANLKCYDVVALGRTPYTGWHGRISDYDKEMIHQAINKVGMEDYEIKYFNNLSDGECQKIMIARAIAQDTKYILLDEPTSFLDLPTRYDLVDLLKQLTEIGKTIIFSTHELDIAIKKSDYIGLITDGKLINEPVPQLLKHIRETHHRFEHYI